MPMGFVLCFAQTNQYQNFICYSFYNVTHICKDNSFSGSMSREAANNGWSKTAQDDKRWDKASKAANECAPTQSTQMNLGSVTQGTSEDHCREGASFMDIKRFGGKTEDGKNFVVFNYNRFERDTTLSARKRWWAVETVVFRDFHRYPSHGRSMCLVWAWVVLLPPTAKLHRS